MLHILYIVYQYIIFRYIYKGGINEIKDHTTESAGELVSITQFMLEKSQLEYLRTGRFFGCFKECKAFNAWRYYARHSAVVKANQEVCLYI
jgi:hypothetical protein